MRVTSKGQVTIPQNVREDMGIKPSETEIEFVREKNGKWFINKAASDNNRNGRFRKAHTVAQLKMSTEEIMSLMRD